MKTSLTICVAARVITATLAASSSGAAGSPAAGGDRARVPVIAETNSLGSVETGSKLIGAAVRSPQNDKLGKIEDMAIDLEAGRIVEVIVSTGGLPKNMVGTPPIALAWDPKTKAVRLNSTRKQLQSAPRFDMANWSECCEPLRILETYRYFGQEAPFLTSRTGMTASARLEKASKVIGMRVRNKRDEKIGTIENLITDLEAGRIVAVLVSSGRFLRLGSSLNPVPPQALRYRGSDELTLDVSKQALQAAPQMKRSEWQKLGESSYVAELYRAYRVQPDSGTTTVNSDGTRVRVRNRDARTPNVREQERLSADAEISGRIRAALARDARTAAPARNLEILTRQGRVTLRGSVKSAEEKVRIGTIAAEIVPAENINNQLDVEQPSRNR